MQSDILCFGEPMVELNQHEPGGPFYPGEGGDASNAACSAARQGAKVGFITSLGDDLFAKPLRELWTNEGVDTAGVMTNPAAPTGVYFVTHGPNGHEFHYRRAGSAASLYKPEDLPVDLLKQAKVLHFSAISQAISDNACESCYEAARIVHEAGGLVSYDTNLRLSLWGLEKATGVILKTLEMSDIVLPGLDDAQQFSGLTDADAITDFLLEKGAKIVALTMGGDGVMVATPEKRETIPSHKVELKDATGAGDAFDGAFLSEYLRIGDPFKAAHYANAAAAISVTGFGAVAPLPTRKEVEAFMAAEAAKA